MWDGIGILHSTGSTCSIGADLTVFWFLFVTESLIYEAGLRAIANR